MQSLRTGIAEILADSFGGRHLFDPSVAARGLAFLDFPVDGCAQMHNYFFDRT